MSFPPYSAWEFALLQLTNTPHQPSASSPDHQLGHKLYQSKYHQSERALVLIDSMIDFLICGNNFTYLFAYSPTTWTIA